MARDASASLVLCHSASPAGKHGAEDTARQVLIFRNGMAWLMAYIGRMR